MMKDTTLPSSQSRFDPEYPLTDESVDSKESAQVASQVSSQETSLKALRGHAPEFVDGAVRIPLTKGQFALVDVADLERVGAWRWSATSNCGQWYAVRVAAGKRVYLHRYLLDNPDGIVDHINGDPLDCRSANLRVVDARGNAANRRKVKKAASSRFVGVVWDGYKWVAAYRVNGRKTTIGRFDDEVEAADARDAAMLKEYGDVAYLNRRTA